MKTDAKWKRFDTLRVTGRNLSGLEYSYRYAKKHKDMKASGGGCMDAKDRMSSVIITERIELKEDASGEILYRMIGKGPSGSGHQEFHTQLGTFLSEDCGEFGGSITTPEGTVHGGNFRYMFDLKDKVYGVDSSVHMMSAHCNLFCFSSAENAACIYSVGGLIQWLINYTEGEKISEDLYCAAIDVKSDKAYLLLLGTVRKEVENGRMHVLYLPERRR